jgi:hypothetical protein
MRLPGGKRLRWALGGLAIAGALALSPAFAATLGVSSKNLTVWTSSATVCSNPGPQTVNPNIDSYVREDSATTNFGTATTVFVRSGSGARRRTFVRFNLPATPSGCSLTAATLRLFTTTAAAGRTLQVFRSAAAWTETGITWNLQPGTTGTAVTAASGAGWIQWNVLTHANALYSGTNNGFTLRDASETTGSASQTFSSREAASNKPELVLTFG